MTPTTTAQALIAEGPKRGALSRFEDHIALYTNDWAYKSFAQYLKEARAVCAYGLELGKEYGFADLARAADRELLEIAYRAAIGEIEVEGICADAKLEALVVLGELRRKVYDRHQRLFKRALNLPVSAEATAAAEAWVASQLRAAQ